jgi:phosphoglycerate dehydrogenase-like enzyme
VEESSQAKVGPFTTSRLRQLVEALEQGRLAGAALDVFATEPLDPGSALWDLPNVLLSPHTARLSVYENNRIVALSAKTCVGIWRARIYSAASPAPLSCQER